MRREICADSIPGETRVALLEDGVLTEIQIERAASLGVAGNVYLGRVRTILPGMQAAFVDVGLERDGFLYVEDAGAPPADFEGDLVEPDGREAGEPAGDDAGRRAGDPRRAAARIEDLVREGQEILVQVAKDPMAHKGSRITCHIALPGRLLVFLPGVPHIGVSRRIADPAERERLRGLAGEVAVRLGAPGGFIVRTAGALLEPSDFETEARALAGAWEAIRRRRAGAAAPALLHREADAVSRALRELLREGIETLTVDSEETYEAARAALQRGGFPAPPHLRRHPGPEPLFEARGLDVQLERALRPRVWLRSGGHIVINTTEALVAIDVNTGKYVGRDHLEDTILRTNLEAVREIVRQIRLRDLGGIIVIDLIDMRREESRAQVIALLEEDLRRDRSRSRMLQISEFGLVEITRQRTRPSLERVLGRSCPTCGGAGVVRSLDTLALEIVRAVRRRLPVDADRTIGVRVPADAVEALRSRAAELAEAIGTGSPERLAIEADPTLRSGHWSVEIR